MSWRYALAAVAGAGHVTQGVPCQDACRAQTATFAGRSVWWAVVSDGAGSAAAGAAGAAAVCTTMMAQIDAWLAAHAGAVEALTAPDIDAWLAAVSAQVAELAAATAAPRADYAATLLAVVANARATVACQVGDGAIVAQFLAADGDTGSDADSDAESDAAEDAALCVLLWPSQGEYINTTHFVTDEDAVAQLRVALLPPARCIALFTDGLQQLALHYATRTAHAPFFAPLFARLAQAPPGASASLNRALAAFLDSAAVNQRTDDDKALVLACAG